MKKALLVLATTTLMISGCMSTSKTSNDTNNLPSNGYKILDTRIGKLTFENGFEHGVPTLETSQKLFDEVDFQRATQAYIWATPIVSFYEWMNDHTNEWKLERGQLVFQETYRQKLGGLTYNTVTPYLMSFISLSNGPVMIKIPSNELRGAVHNMWQIGKGQMTKIGTYVIYKAGEEAPKVKGATLVAMDTNDFFFGVRLMNTDANVRKQHIKEIEKNITNLSGKRLSEKAIFNVIKGTDHKQPRGIRYWEVVHQFINANPVHERDRMMMDMLTPLGIEKGKPFNPTKRQKKILIEAATIGEAMTKNIDFNKTGRLAQSEYGGHDNSWEIATASTPEQNRDYGMDLDGRAAWFYEAVTNDIAMHGMSNGGWGQVYLDNYYSGNKEAGLDGGKAYKLHIKHPESYANLFWNITVYSVENRAIINNEQGRADVGANIEGTEYNKDGSVTLYFSPTKPKGVSETNWIQTIYGENWFVYFRAYSPKKEFVEQQPHTIVPNFELVNQ